MFGLHKWSLISFSRKNQVVIAACTRSRESCFSWWGQRFGSDFFFASINFRPPLADSWYSLSYLYLAVLGTLVTMASGLVVSIITGESLSSQLWFLTREIKSSCVCLRDVSCCHFVKFCFQVVASRKNAALICLWGRATWSASSGPGRQR